MSRDNNIQYNRWTGFQNLTANTGNMARREANDTIQWDLCSTRRRQRKGRAQGYDRRKDLGNEQGDRNIIGRPRQRPLLLQKGSHSKQTISWMVRKQMFDSKVIPNGPKAPDKNNKCQQKNINKPTWIVLNAIKHITETRRVPVSVQPRSNTSLAKSRQDTVKKQCVQCFSNLHIENMQH